MKKEKTENVKMKYEDVNMDEALLVDNDGLNDGMESSILLEGGWNEAVLILVNFWSIMCLIQKLN